MHTAKSPCQGAGRGQRQGWAVRNQGRGGRGVGTMQESCALLC